MADYVFNFTDGLRFSPVTPENHAGQLWIVSILALIYSLLSLVIRGHIKLGLYGMDDGFLAAGTVAHIAQTVVVFIALKHGVGESSRLLDDQETERAGQVTFISVVLYLIGLCLAKCSVITLMLRIFSRDMLKLRILCLAILSLFLAWGIAAVLGVCINCNSATYLSSSSVSKCGSQLLRWQLITAFDVVSEAVLVALPILMVWSMQMSFQLKLQVVVAFAFRLPVAGLSVVHVYYVSRYAKSNNISLVIVPALLIQQVHICWSLLSATIPNLKSFMKSFNSGFGLDLGLDTQFYGSGEDSKDMYGEQSGYRMDTMRSQHRRMASVTATTTGRAATPNFESSLRPEAVERSTIIVHPERTEVGAEDASITSAGSQEMIIRRDVRWNVSYEPPRA